MHCPRCKEIALDEFIRNGYQRWTESEEADLSLDVPWYPSLRVLTFECELCRLVRQSLEASLVFEAARQEANGDISVGRVEEDLLQNINGYLDFPMAMSLQISSSTLDKARKRANFILTVSVSSGISWGLTLNADFRIATGYDNPWTQKILGRTVAKVPDGKEAFSVVDNWIRSCLDGHEYCSEPAKLPLLPTRVIDVSPSESNSGMVCLRDEESKTEPAAPYIALSHCWGKGIPFITTTTNLKDRKAGINFGEMPQALQDAIHITRRLGVQYIWIDTLCIVQDDIKDWQIEAGRMVNVYQDAFLVIGASNSSSDDHGFLGCRRSRDSIRLADLDLQLLPPDGERWTSGGDPVSHEPLQSRAWCLQERYLARRMLLYGADQLFWECRTVSQAEDGDAVAHNPHHLDRLCETAAIERSIFGPRPLGDAKVNYRGWYEMVEEYMRRNITVQSDRLPALSGLANAMAQISKDTYMAGLWKKGLVEGLLWSGTSHEKPLQRASPTHAPSWSWASVEGPVQFIVYSFFERCRWKRGIADYESLATFVACHLETDGPDPYGKVVEGGRLRLRAPLLPVKNIYPADKNLPSSDVLMTPLKNPVLDYVVEVAIENKCIYLQAGFDQIPTLTQLQPLSVVFLARLPDGNSGFSPFIEHRFGLLVTPTDTDNVYQRVGIIDSPVLIQDTGGIWRFVIRILERLIRLLERFSTPKARSPISFLTPQLFVPDRGLKEEPEEEMPDDPLPEIKQYLATVTLE
ncbi:hypothetical protein ASPWEDRAFT_172166 [Aspergillus wentii DTO 134E9]|uniref:Heterokaryon incompatibility domain-containing protein n=1 Tax=Aspergillus wentii DTO 134E9 TaxID=1073089 RepID=A0A1L9RKC2_ASPWE|nr:uncharacterized protein ASPWEDRAFT_172166 [Aspergillus wentii DTO 134E9]KAI9924872.1 hypothetical protein MW887_006729 [Aspergillus wentii]OJJ35354.1 hypothetical protein ASPWEDRAFT_172166 [Aspergillus wentii DTO 134E9]